MRNMFEDKKKVAILLCLFIMISFSFYRIANDEKITTDTPKEKIEIKEVKKIYDVKKDKLLKSLSNKMDKAKDEEEFPVIVVFKDKIYEIKKNDVVVEGKREDNSNDEGVTKGVALIGLKVLIAVKLVMLDLKRKFWRLRISDFKIYFYNSKRNILASLTGVFRQKNIVLHFQVQAFTRLKCIHTRAVNIITSVYVKKEIT